MFDLIRRELDRLSGNSAVRTVGVLVGGTAFAQALTIAALPLLTRLYTPADFSLLAVYAATLAILAPVACIRFEIAIPIPRADEDAINLLALALVGSATIAILCAFIVLSCGAWFVLMTRSPELKPYLWLIPVAVWFAGNYAALQYWLTRKKRFPLIAKTRISRAVGGIGVQVAGGLFSVGPFGLLFGDVIGNGAGVFRLMRDFQRHDITTLAAVSLRHMFAMFSRFKRFPQYATVESLANNAGVQIPVLLVAAFVVGPEVGFLLLAMRVMAAPVSLIGGAVAQVYLSKAPEADRAGILGNLTADMIGGLIRAGLGPLLFVGLVAPSVFPIIFGSSWAPAGRMVTWMTPWFLMQFLASPISMALHVKGRQVTALLLQLFGLIIRTGAVGLAAWLATTAVVEAYAISSFLFYLVYFFVVKHITSVRLSMLSPAFRAAMPSLLAWVSFAFLLVSGFSFFGIGV